MVSDCLLAIWQRSKVENTATSPYACLRLSTPCRRQSIYDIDIACMLHAAVNSDLATTKSNSASAPAIASMAQDNAAQLTSMLTSGSMAYVESIASTFDI